MTAIRGRRIGRVAAWCLLAASSSAVWANGTETLGPPAGINIATGTGVAVGGIGLSLQQPGIINVNVPAGATVRQVILYWEGFEFTNVAGDADITVSGIPVTAALIGGPTFFFERAYTSAFRADITSLNLVHAGANALSISDVNFSRITDGAGIVVIYAAGGPSTQINLRDGDDAAFLNFVSPLNATVPQTFTFPSSNIPRNATVNFLVGSVETDRPSTIRATSGGQVTELHDVLNDTDGEMWDTVTMIVNVPAGAASVTVEVISGPPEPNRLPASLVWVTGTFSIPPAPAVVPPNRVSDSQKGSVLIYPKVELRWDGSGRLVQDTFVDLTNDYPADVLVQMYFVNGDPPITDCGSDGGGDRGEGVPNETCEPGWNWVDVEIPLTANQPTYWSAATGLPATGGVSPFTVLDPGTPPGRYDPTTGNWVLRGYIVAYAVNANGEEINWNHLKGDAMLINYAWGSAWEYNAFAFQAHSGEIGTSTGTPGVLNLDGIEFDAVYDLLLLDFYATQGFTTTAATSFALDTDITLLPVDIDLRQETTGPVTTKASFTVWNQNEAKLTGMDLCVTCWDQRLASQYGIPNHFLRQNLQTDKGKAQIDGLASQLCDRDYDPGDGLRLGQDPRDVVSRQAPFLGLSAKQIYFGSAGKTEMAGSTIPGMGLQAGVIRVDFLGGPPPELVAHKRVGQQASGAVTAPVIRAE